MDTSSLMEQILSKDNLNAAYLQVIRNKGAAGVDGMTIKDGDIISIVRKFLVSGIMLNELDKELEARKLHFVRYADDCIIMVGSEMAANRVMRNVTKFLEEKLWLHVNGHEEQSRQTEGH